MGDRYVIRGDEFNPLSPMYPLRIQFSGRFIYSAESFFLSLPIQNVKHQAHVCSEPGEKAVKLASKYREKSDMLASTDVLFWNEKPLERDSQELDILIDRFFCELVTHTEVSSACLDCGKSTVEIHPSALTKIGYIINREEYARRLSYLIATERVMRGKRESVVPA